jgi:hypothetical protein
MLCKALMISVVALQQAAVPMDRAQIPGPTAHISAIDSLKLAFDRETFTKKFTSDTAHTSRELRLDQTKAWITGVATLVPLLVAAISFAVANQARLEEAREARQTNREQTAAQFELKAAELAFNTPGIFNTWNRARALKALFPERLPHDFVDNFNPADYSGISAEAKLELFKAMVAHPTDRRAILDLWCRIFPGDQWAREILAAERPPT